jgi:hypothetical protein
MSFHTGVASLAFFHAGKASFPRNVFKEHEPSTTFTDTHARGFQLAV